MKTRPRFWAGLVPLAFLLAGALLSSCGGELAQLGGKFGAGAGAEKAPEIRLRGSGGNMEMILHPVAVWDEKDVAAPHKVEIGGREVFVRLRGGDFWDKPFVRAGLFWNARRENIYLPVAVFGPPVDIRGLEIRAGNSRATLRRAGDEFNYTPAGSWDSAETSSAAFELKPKMLRAVAAADFAQLIIKTNRGNLHLGLDVVGDDSEESVRRNARYLFALFAEKMAAAKGNG
ncbi:MAG: hypothetical protein ACR2P5_04320 [Gammaproteobacteria bacterium]